MTGSQAPGQNPNIMGDPEPCEEVTDVMGGPGPGGDVMSGPASPEEGSDVMGEAGPGEAGR
jgi:hypothetical protein